MNVSRGPNGMRRRYRRVKRIARITKSIMKMSDDLLYYTEQSIPHFAGRYSRECPICNYTGMFRAFGEPPRYDAMCTGCGSLERHRLLFMKCIQPGDFDNCSLLHFAPENIVRKLLEDRAGNYLSADIQMPGVDVHLDMENIDLPSMEFDVVLANHVLEHVDDKKALGELFRILKKGGKFYCMIPIVEGWPTTYEDPDITDDSGRNLHFGQSDHVRIYGRDYLSRIQSAGFTVHEILASGPETVKYGLIPGDKIIVCEKP